MGKTGKKILILTVGMVLLSMALLGIMNTWVFGSVYEELKVDVEKVVAESVPIFDAEKLKKSGKTNQWNRRNIRKSASPWFSSKMTRISNTSTPS